MNDDLFYLFGIVHLLSRLSLEKQDGVSASQATCLLVHSFTCPLTMLPIEVSKSHDKDKNRNVDPQNLFLTKRLSKFALAC